MAVNILDFAMVIESVHRRSLWKIFRANGIPSHLVEIIKSFYDNFTCSVGDGDFLFKVDTGVRNGCVMSTLLFNLVVTRSCGAPLRISLEASDGQLSPTWKTWIESWPQH